MKQNSNASANEAGVSHKQEVPTEGTVISLHISPAAHIPMTALSLAHLVPGRGIVGDRHYLRRGRDAAADRFSCDVTLVEEETIEAMKRREPSIDPGESARRNIVVRGCELSQLAGHTFRIGEVTLQGHVPRNRSDVSLEEAQHNPPQESAGQAARCLTLPHPDLRATVLMEGTISVGDRIEVI